MEAGSGGGGSWEMVAVEHWGGGGELEVGEGMPGAPLLLPSLLMENNYSLKTLSTRESHLNFLYCSVTVPEVYNQSGSGHNILLSWIQILPTLNNFQTNKILNPFLWINFF